MTAPPLVLYVCPECGHEVAALPTATTWCIRRAHHLPRTGPIAMRPKDQIHPNTKENR